MCLATECVVLAVAALALNRLVGYTGLVSFGHCVWFGLGAYGVALSQRHLLEGQMLVPALVTLVMTAAVALALGFLILRRRGVYFSLLTLALTAVGVSVRYPWPEVTCGDSWRGAGARTTHTARRRVGKKRGLK